MPPHRLTPDRCPSPRCSVFFRASGLFRHRLPGCRKIGVRFPGVSLLVVAQPPAYIRNASGVQPNSSADSADAETGLIPGLPDYPEMPAILFPKICANPSKTPHRKPWSILIFFVTAGGPEGVRIYRIHRVKFRSIHNLRSCPACSSGPGFFRASGLSWHRFWGAEKKKRAFSGGITPGGRSTAGYYLPTLRVGVLHPRTQAA
jgi:hypothetical protein